MLVEVFRNPFRHSAFKNLAQILTSRVFASLISFLWTIYIIRLTAPEVLASYSWVMALIPIVLLLSDFGCKNSLVRQLPALVKEGAVDQITQAVSLAFRLKARIFFPVALGLYFWLSFGVSNSNYTGGFLPLLAVILLTVLTYYYFLETILQSHLQFRDIAWIRLLPQFSRITLLLLVRWYPTLPVILCTEILSYSLTSIIFHRHLKTELRWRDIFKTIGRDELSNMKSALFTGFWLFASELIGMSIKRINILLLAHLSTPLQLAHYVSAQKLTVPVDLLLQSLTYTLLPRFFQIDRNVIYQRTRFVYYWISLWLIILLVFLSLPIDLEFLSELLYNGKYTNLGTIFRFIIASIICSLLYQPLILIMHRLGKSHIVTLFYGVILILSLSANIILIPSHAGEGAAMALLMARALGVILFAGYAVYLLVKKQPEPTDE